MQIDTGLLLSVLSLGVAAIVAVTNIRRNARHDDKREATELTTLLVKIENINNGINEIKSDVRNMRQDIQDVRERLVIVEQSVKSAHHRLDALEGKESER